MDQLAAHYDEILAKLQKQTNNPSRKDFFGKSWAMQHRPLQTEKCNLEKALSLQAEDVHSVSLTKEDMIYLFQGQVDRRWRFMIRRLEEWIELYISLYAEELFEDVPIDRTFKETEPLDIIHMYEANEVEYLLIECRTYLERLLLATAAKWSHLVQGRHENMANAVLHCTLTQVHDDASRQPNTRQHGEEIRSGELSSRLIDERKDLLDTELRLQMENRRNRVHSQADATEKRIHARKYNDPVGEKIAASWKEMTEKVTRAMSDADSDDEDDCLGKTSTHSLYLEEQTPGVQGTWCEVSSVVSGHLH